MHAYLIASLIKPRKTCMRSDGPGQSAIPPLSTERTNGQARGNYCRPLSESVPEAGQQLGSQALPTL